MSSLITKVLKDNNTYLLSQADGKMQVTLITPNTTAGAIYELKSGEYLLSLNGDLKISRRGPVGLVFLKPEEIDALLTKLDRDFFGIEPDKTDTSTQKYGIDIIK